MSYLANRSAGTPGAPLILTFHGTGGDEGQFHGLASDLLPSAHVVSPRGDVSEMGALRYFKRASEGVYDMADLARATAKMTEFVAAEIARTGATRVIGLGYSNGANILASTMLERPGLFTDAILLHPLIPWTPEPAPTLAGTRLLITAGRHDPICPAPQTEALAQYLQAQDTDLVLHWHDGGHTLAPSELSAIQDFLA